MRKPKVGNKITIKGMDSSENLCHGIVTKVTKVNVYYTCCKYDLKMYAPLSRVSHIWKQK